MEVEGAEPTSSTQPQVEVRKPERGFIEALKQKPDEIKQWWAELTAVFDKSFLALICSLMPTSAMIFSKELHAGQVQQIFFRFPLFICI